MFGPGKAISLAAKRTSNLDTIMELIIAIPTLSLAFAYAARVWVSLPKYGA